MSRAMMPRPLGHGQGRLFALPVGVGRASGGRLFEMGRGDVAQSL